MAFKPDTYYKRLFSFPYFVQKLLESFVHEKFIENLDFSTLKRLDKSFVSREYQQKESDLIYSVNFKENPVYIFLLIEFQSTVDKMMPVRFLRYITELYETFHAKTVSGKLPAVFPLLLYSGDPKWTAAVEISDMIEKNLPDKYIPCFSYYPVLENEISKESLLKIRNIVSAIFYVENSNLGEVKDEIDKIIEIISKEDSDAKREFSNWFNSYLSVLDRQKGKNELSFIVEDTMEVKAMFATRTKEYIENIRQEGIEKGEARVVLNMEKLGYSPEKIAELTGLSIDEINRFLEK